MLKLFAAAVTASVVALVVTASASSSPPTFSNQILRAPATLPGITTSPADQSGDSEPAIDFGGPDNTMVVDGLGWLPFAVNLWKGHFGDTPPAFFGAMDTSLPIQGNGRVNLGDGDADVEVTTAGTILLADLDIIFNRTGRFTGLGVSVTRCPAAATSKAATPAAQELRGQAPARPRNAGTVAVTWLARTSAQPANGSSRTAPRAEEANSRPHSTDQHTQSTASSGSVPSQVPASSSPTKATMPQNQPSPFEPSPSRTSNPA